MLNEDCQEYIKLLDTAILLQECKEVVMDDEFTKVLNEMDSWEYILDVKLTKEQQAKWLGNE